MLQLGFRDSSTNEMGRGLAAMRLTRTELDCYWQGLARIHFLLEKQIQSAEAGQAAHYLP